MYNQNNSVVRNCSYFNVCKNLVLSDLIIFQQMFVDKFIDVAIWVVLTLFVTAYVMPKFGLSDSFGVFQLAGMLAAIGLFELYTSAIDLVSDLQGDRIIDYTLTLPIPSWLAIASKAAYYAIIYFILTVLMLPIGKLSLWYQLDLSAINYVQFLFVIIFQSIFYACFTIWVGSIIGNVAKLGTVWARCIFPMWFMGGFQFSWMALYSVAPIAGWINLCNPMMYITEATRVAILGQADYLNFWMCLGAIVLFSIITFVAGLWNLKQRLDFIV